MTYDFSQFYKTSTFEILDNNDNEAFEVTVKQITHGARAAIQKKMLGNLHMPQNKQDAKKQMASIKLDVTAMTDETNIASIESWTLTQNNKPIPVCIAAWNALPNYITEQIEKGIKVLNPELDEEFQD